MMDSISQHGGALAILLLIGLVIAVPVIIAADLAKKARARGELHQQQFVGVAPQQWFQQLFLEIGGLRNRAVTMQTPDTAIITTTYIPGWTLIPIILLFPIGLLFLLVKNTHTTTVLAIPQGTGTVIQINGYLNDDRLRKKLQELEKRLGAIPTGTVAMPSPLQPGLPAPPWANQTAAPAPMPPSEQSATLAWPGTSPEPPSATTGPWPVSPGLNNPPPPVEATPDNTREIPQP